MLYLEFMIIAWFVQINLQLPDEQKSLNRETEASETELATANDCAEPLDVSLSFIFIGTRFQLHL